MAVSDELVGFVREALTRGQSRPQVEESVIVSLPVFLYMPRLTSRVTDLDPNGRTSPVRRWLTYLTLFVAACVLIGDFTSLVYNLLGGELTVRFVLKALTVGLIAGTVFWYYLSDLRLDENEVRA